jgi:two-component system response regulator QseB
MRVLIVEDDRLLGEGLCAGLKQEGYAVDWLKDGSQVKHVLQVEPYDVVVLDLGLPGCDGMELLGWMRKTHLEIPVLILTARDTQDDKVQGLDLGADDYMTKPFDLVELVARLRALIRRSRGRATPVIEWGALVLDPSRRSVSFEGQPVELSPREYAVLETLLEHGGRVVSRSRLAESVYSWDNDIESNALEVYIHHLRKKLSPDLIRTVRGVGYMLREQK